MDHYPDPYDNETEARSRDYSHKALAVVAVIAVLLLICVICLNLWGE